MSGFWDKLFSKRQPAPQCPPDVSADAEGLTVAEMDGEEAVYVRVPWTSITTILAHRQDVFGVEQLRFEVLTDLADEAVLITEDDTGFEAFLQGAVSFLPGIGASWAQDLAAMQIVPGEVRVLYRREAGYSAE
ncbi:MAG: hypothetical protein PW735_01290 [Acidobacteriaceae bacterium]|nr:hypothetical protein [Acidobacteriaceae bacterium]